MSLDFGWNHPVGWTFTNGTPKIVNPRDKYHTMLDQAMNETKEGATFLGRFIELVIEELKNEEIQKIKY